jgi:septum formation protein
MPNKQSSLFLASSSPRRRELLKQLGLQFEVLQPNVDESILPNEAHQNYVLRLSQVKAAAGLALLADDESQPVLGSDTIVFCEGKILGKPENQEHAIEMLTLLSGKSHEVLTAVTLATQDKSASAVSTTIVQFKKLTTSEIETYWQTGEPKGKAGAYAIQGLGAVFIKKIEGSYSGVMGLPLFETAELLSQFGVNTLPISVFLNL